MKVSPASCRAGRSPAGVPRAVRWGLSCVSDCSAVPRLPAVKSRAWPGAGARMGPESANHGRGAGRGLVVSSARVTGRR